MLKYLSFLLLQFVLLSPIEAQEQHRDRTAYFRMAEMDLPYVVRFLTRSNRFMASLTDLEKDQLQRIKRITDIKLHSDFMPNSDLKYLTLAFNPNPKDFDLNPDEPTRLAKTTEVFDDPIEVNLSYLNSNYFNPNYLSILQLYLHEVGHKLGASKQITAIDQLGAKMVHFLTPFFKRISPRSEFFIEFLGLPERDGSNSFESSFKNKIIVTNRGVANFHYLYLPNLLPLVKKFNGSQQGDGNFDEVSIYRFTGVTAESPNERALSFGLTFDFEVTSTLVWHSGIIGFTSGIAIDESTQTLTPITQTNPMVPWQTLNFSFDLRASIPDLERIPQYLSPDPFTPWQWNFIDSSFENRIISADLNKNIVELVLEKSISEPVLLEVKFAHGTLHLKPELLEPQANDANHKQILKFQIPYETPAAQIYRIIIGGSRYSALPKIIELGDPSSQPEESELKFEDVQFFSKDLNWVSYRGRETIRASGKAPRLRIKLHGKSHIRQVRLLWIYGSTIVDSQSGHPFGTFSLIEEEVVDKIHEGEPTSGDKYIELESEEIAKSKLVEINSQFSKSIDAGRRFLKRIVVTDEFGISKTWNFTNHLKIFNDEVLLIEPNCSRLLN